MEPEVLSLFVQMVESGANLAFEAVRRKKSKESLRATEALQALDTSAIAARIGPLELASFMTGGVTAAEVKELMGRRDFRGLTRELFVVCLVSDRDSSTTETARSSLVLLAEAALSESAGRDDAHAFGEALADRLIELSYGAVDAMNQADPSLLSQLQQTALLKRIASMIDAVDAHNRAVVRFANTSMAQARDKFVESYRRACVERHGYITPPDFETNRKIPMELLYVAPNIRKLQGTKRDRALEVSQFLDTADRTVVLGDPGGGKSTLSGYIASRLAADAGGPLPLHVTLRHFAPHMENLSLLEFIEREMQPRYQVAPVEGLIEDLLLTGNAFVVFDGLDELIDASKRRDVTKSVEVFGSHYPLTPIIVTSRRVGYDQARLDPAIFDAYLIDGFEVAEVERYVHNWFHSQSEYEEKEAKEQAALFIDQSAAVPDLRSNPLMLALMCIIFRGENYIPRNRPAVYEKCAKMLFEKWDGHRGIEVPLQARDHVDAAMKYIAYRFMNSGAGDSGIEEKRVVSMLAEYLHPRAVESAESAQQAAKEFVDYCAGRAWVFSDAGATADGEPIFTFTHRTFMEYFAAVHLTRITDTPEALANLLLPHVAREEWDVIAQLAVQQIDGTTDQGTHRVLTAMLTEKRKRSVTNRGNVLRFIARCLAFAVVPPSLVRNIASACVQYVLENPNAQSTGRARTPLQLLRAHTSGLEAEYAAGQADAELNAALGEDSQRLTALAIAFEWLSLDQLSELQLSPTVVPWMATAVSFAETHRELLRSATDSKTVIPQLFGWHGIMSVEAAHDEIQRSPTDFTSRYFVAPQLSDGRRIGPSLSEILYYTSDVTVDSLTTSQESHLSALATGFVENFFSMHRTLPAGTARRKLVQGVHIYLLSPVQNRASQEIVDALVLSTLASVEMYLASERPSHKTATRDLFTRHWLDEETREPLGAAMSVVSPRVAEFAKSWLQEKVAVFDNSGYAVALAEEVVGVPSSLPVRGTAS